MQYAPTIVIVALGLPLIIWALWEPYHIAREIIVKALDGLDYLDNEDNT